MDETRRMNKARKIFEQYFFGRELLPQEWGELRSIIKPPSPEEVASLMDGIQQAALGDGPGLLSMAYDDVELPPYRGYRGVMKWGDGSMLRVGKHPASGFLGLGSVRYRVGRILCRVVFRVCFGIPLSNEELEELLNKV